MANQNTNQRQFLDDSVESPDLPDDETTDEDIPDNVTVNGDGIQQNNLAQQADLGIELEEEGVKGSVGADNIDVQRSYKVDGTIYQEVTYKGAIDGKFYKTANGKDISEQEFYDKAPKQVRNKHNGGQITQYQFNQGNQYYKTAEVGGKPTREKVDNVEWATASKYEIKSYQKGGNGNATIYTPDGLQRTTVSEVREAMREVGNYKRTNGAVNRRVKINGKYYTAKELYVAGKDSPLPDGQIFVYDGQ